MAGIADYSTTAGSNTAVGGVSIAEGMAPGNVNNAIRALMADLATLYSTMYREDNIVGTVTQSGGDPTGAAMEFGSGANGLYCRFAMGLQFCLSSTLQFTRATNITATCTWTFPAAYIGTPWAVGLFLHALPSDGGQYSGITSTSIAGLFASHSALPTTSVGLTLINNDAGTAWGSGATVSGVRVASLGLWFDPS